MKITAQDYGQFLCNSHQNFTGTYFADTADVVMHDDVYRFLKNNKLTPAILREKMSSVIEYSDDGILIIDDSVMDKQHSSKIEIARPVYSGAEHHVIHGIDIINLGYYNPDTDKFYPLDYRIYSKKTDGKTKTEHAMEMIQAAVYRGVRFRRVAMDSGYSTAKMLNLIMDHDKTFIAAVKSNRLFGPNETKQMTNVDKLEWNNHHKEHGYTGKLKDMPKTRPVKLFRIAAVHSGSEYVVTNDELINTASDAQKASANRWNVEEFHREIKQVTGVEKCQARLGRSQRNHILIAYLVWLQLKLRAWVTGQTIYEVKQKPLMDFVAMQWRRPSIVFEVDF